MNFAHRPLDTSFPASQHFDGWVFWLLVNAAVPLFPFHVSSFFHLFTLAVAFSCFSPMTCVCCRLAQFQIDILIKNMHFTWVDWNQRALCLSYELYQFFRRCHCCRRCNQFRSLLLILLFQLSALPEAMRFVPVCIDKKKWKQGTQKCQVSGECTVWIIEMIMANGIIHGLRASDWKKKHFLHTAEWGKKGTRTLRGDKLMNTPILWYHAASNLSNKLK